MATEVKAAGAKKAEAGRTKATASRKASKPRTKKSEDTETSKHSKEKERRLSEEALVLTGSESSKIVERLMTQAMKGYAKSAEMLSDLAKREAEAKKAMEHGPHRSQVLAWAAEPPWRGESDEEKAESGGGSLEAE
jgi:hypothetical protein